MVIQVLHCAHCQSQNVIRHGKDKAGRQRYRCHDCRRTRQVVAYAVGDRGVRTCRLLWERVPRGLRHALTFTDFWGAYQKVVPEGQHVACGKGSGQTNHVERFNNTLRQRLARFVRQTLSFSKSDEMHEMHETCLRLFLHHYNTQMAPGVAASQQHS